jgi:hypothetical protein
MFFWYMTPYSLVDGTYVWDEPTFHTCTHSHARHTTHAHIRDSNIQCQKNFKGKHEFVPDHILKAYIGRRGIVPIVLNSGARWRSALHNGHSTPRDGIPCTPFIGGWVSPRAGLEEELAPARNQTQIIQPIP